MPVHAINMGSGGIAPLIVNLYNRWMWLVSCMPWLLLLLEYEGFDDARSGLEALD
jgi:hypothetical protein